MKRAFPRSAACDLMCRQAGLRRAGFRPGRAERAEKAEGKIKQTSTTSGRFEGKPLSAHCSGAPFPAPWFLPRRAGDPRKALHLLDFDRHYSPETGVFRVFGAESANER